MVHDQVVHGQATPMASSSTRLRGLQPCRSAGIRALTLYQQGGRGEHSTVLSYEKAPQPRRSMKPVGLMEELIRRFSRPNDTVLDPCMKTGVSGVAARKLGRTFIGIEKEQEHYEEAVRQMAP